MAESKIRLHTLKLREQFLGPISRGDLKAITRSNSRGFNAGDYVRFKVLPLDGNSVEYSLVSASDRKAFESSYFRITFVMSGFGLKEGYATVSFVREDDGSRIAGLDYERQRIKRVSDEQSNPLDAYAPLLSEIGYSSQDDSGSERTVDDEYRPHHRIESLDETMQRVSSNF